jgi:hypothetical protein
MSVVLMNAGNETKIKGGKRVRERESMGHLKLTEVQCDDLHSLFPETYTSSKQSIQPSTQSGMLEALISRSEIRNYARL